MTATIPPRLIHRPLDKRGYVIPWVQFIADDGSPNFAVMDHYKTMEALRRRLCGLCGQPLGKHKYFVGGDLCVANRYFYDPPMHRECAVYALQACPHLARVKGRYREPPAAIEGQKLVIGSMEITKCEHFALMHTDRIEQWGRTPEGMLIVRAGPWLDIEYWQEGKPVGPVPPPKDEAHDEDRHSRRDARQAR